MLSCENYSRIRALRCASAGWRISRDVRACHQAGVLLLCHGLRRVQMQELQQRLHAWCWRARIDLLKVHLVNNVASAHPLSSLIFTVHAPGMSKTVCHMLCVADFDSG